MKRFLWDLAVPPQGMIASDHVHHIPTQTGQKEAEHPGADEYKPSVPRPHGCRFSSSYGKAMVGGDAVLQGRETMETGVGGS